MPEDDIQKRINDLNELVDAKNWDALEQAANQFIEDYPDRAEGFTYRGFAKSRLGHHQEAIEDHNKAIDIDPNYAKAFNGRGIAKARLELHEEAIRDYNKAIEIDHKYAKAYSNRGTTKSELGHQKEAIEDYDKAIELNSGEAGFYNNRGNAKNKLGQYEEAIEDYDRAIELDSKNVDFHHNRGSTIGRLIEKNTLAQLERITNPQEIIKQFENDINRSHIKLYGFPEGGLSHKRTTKGNGGGEFGGGKGDGEGEIDGTGSGTGSDTSKTSREDEKSKKSLCKLALSPLTFWKWIINEDGKLRIPLRGSLAFKADKASSCLRVFIILIVAITPIGFNYLFPPEPDTNTFSETLRFLRNSLLFTLLVGVFIAFARRANREYKEELNRYFALKRDRNIMIYWTALTAEQKQENLNTMFTHLSENSVANMSFQMSHPKLASKQSDSDEKSKGFFWQRDRKDNTRFDNIDDQLHQIKQAIKDISKNQ